MTRIEGGAALPVTVDATRRVQGLSAIPVYGYDTLPTDGREVIGGAALPVHVLTAADLRQNGGAYYLEGRAAIPVYTAEATRPVFGGPAIPVYPVNAWPGGGGVTPWYLSGGIAAANCEVAYRAKGAASLAASYINLANPGVGNAAPGVAPTFNTLTGWTFDGIAQFLISGLTPNAANHSLFVQMTGLGGAGNRALSVCFDGANFFGTGFILGGWFYDNGTAINSLDADTSDGNHGVAGTKGYRNGVDAGIAALSNLGANRPLYIGARNANGVTDQFAPVTIVAWAAYNVILTQPQITALVAAMAAL